MTPTRKASLLARYMERRVRTPCQVEEVELVTEEDGGGVPLEGAADQTDADNISNEECIAAILLLNNTCTDESYQSATE